MVGRGPSAVSAERAIECIGGNALAADIAADEHAGGIGAGCGDLERGHALVLARRDGDPEV